MTDKEISKILKRLDAFESSNNNQHANLVRAIRQIEASIAPVIEERVARKYLDKQVSKWLPRLATPIVVAILFWIAGWIIKLTNNNPFTSK